MCDRELYWSHMVSPLSIIVVKVDTLGLCGLFSGGISFIIVYEVNDALTGHFICYDTS